jgi:transcriptional regulator with XRE-family HTH domain
MVRTARCAPARAKEKAVTSNVIPEPAMPGRDRRLTGVIPAAAESPRPDRSPLFSMLLRSHRVQAGLTQQALADLSLVSPRAIRDLEAGRANARLKTIALLADGLQLKGPGRERFVNAGLARRPAPFGADFSPVAPRRVNALRGRDREVGALVEVLESGHRRMVCICGLAGVGKTRIAAEIAAQISQRWPVVWMGTQPLASDGNDSTLSSLPRALQPLIESAATDLSLLCPVIGQQRALIVLDGVADVRVPSGVDELLTYCPGVRVVSASRTPWDGAGLQPTVIPPLLVPGPEWDAGHSLRELGTVPSVRLLVDRLSEIAPGFELGPGNAGAVVDMCRKLDGLPLALETMAGRFRVLSLHELAGVAAADMLDLTVSAGPGREPQTIAGLLRWSVDRLTDDRRLFLRELARLERGWTVQDVSRALCRPLDWVVAELGVLAGYGLVGATRGDQVTALHVPNLLRALLRRADQSPSA